LGRRHERRLRHKEFATLIASVGWPQASVGAACAAKGGEREPRDANDTGSGRAFNQRAEIFAKPIVEAEQQARAGQN
jgi:hypothetical protein